MPTSATGATEPPRPQRAHRRPGPFRRARGFTLVEILVVVVIGAVLTGFVLLTLGRAGPAASHERALARLEAAMSELCDRALLTGSAHGARLHASGYDFWVLRPQGWAELPPGSPPPGRWPDSVRPRIRVGSVPLDGSRAAAPQVVCTGIEPPTPFEVTIGSGASQRALAWP